MYLKNTPPRPLPTSTSKTYYPSTPYTVNYSTTNPSYVSNSPPDPPSTPTTGSQKPTVPHYLSGSESLNSV